MCDPVSIGIAGLALSAGGQLYQAQQNQQYARNQNAAEQQRQQMSEVARKAEADRQAKFQAQADANFNTELTKQGAGAITGQVDTGATDALAAAKEAQTTTNADSGLLPGQTGSSVSDVFTKDVARAVADRTAEAQKRIAALSTLAGFDRANGYSKMTGDRFNAEQGLLQGQQRASLALGQQEGNVAKAFVGSPSTIGTAASSLGNAAMAFAPQATKEGLKSIGNTFSSIFA